MKPEFLNLSTHQSKELFGTRAKAMRTMWICMLIILKQLISELEKFMERRLAILFCPTFFYLTGHRGLISGICRDKISHEIFNVRHGSFSDLGDSLNVHPTHKQPVGERLALLALKNTYHQNIIAQGPEVIKVVQDGKNIAIDFKNGKKLQARNNEQLTGFEVMNEKG